METMTKENFFNELQEKYPDAMKHFCDWIDKYKADNGWDNLFNAGIRYMETYVGETHRGGRTRTTVAPKFHELPFAMQQGIMTVYMAQLLPEEEADTWKFLKEMFFDFMDCEQQKIELEKSKLN